MTVHAYIADLPGATEQISATEAHGVSAGHNRRVRCACGAIASDQEGPRCFGLRRLSVVWPVAGHNVTCHGCRATVRALLGDRDMPRAALDDLERRIAEHEARCASEAREAEIVVVEAAPVRVCAYCPAVASGHSSACNRVACRARLAREVRRSGRSRS